MELLWVHAEVFQLLQRSSIFENGFGLRQPVHLWPSRTFERYVRWWVCASMETVEQLVSRCFLEYVGFRYAVFSSCDWSQVCTPYPLDVAYGYFIWGEVVSFYYYCLPCSFSAFYLIRDGATLGLDLDLEVRQGSKDLLVIWHNIEVFAVPPARRRLVYATKLAVGMTWRVLVGFVAIALCSPHFLFLATGQRWCISHRSSLTMGDAGVCSSENQCTLPDSLLCHCTVV